MELAVPVWQPALTKHEKVQIERVQKCAFYIILGVNYLNYSNALKTLGCEELEDRRVKLCEKFALKASKHEKFQTWFCKNKTDEPIINTRAKSKKAKTKYKSVETRTERFKNSPIPYLTELLK